MASFNWRTKLPTYMPPADFWYFRLQNENTLRPRHISCLSEMAYLAVLSLPCSRPTTWMAAIPLSIIQEHAVLLKPTQKRQCPPRNFGFVKVLRTMQLGISGRNNNKKGAHRSCACRSVCGFQSESKIITVSAAVCKLRPQLPALAETRNTGNCSTLSWLKRLIATCLSVSLVEPSSLTNNQPRWFNNSSRTSKTMTNCEKMSTCKDPIRTSNS